ncbi:MAG TPA: hypothetical protein VF596_19535 [Pyrinomonadaceae bacterium]|jgi:hypothetical protein
MKNPNRRNFLRIAGASFAGLFAAVSMKGALAENKELLNSKQIPLDQWLLNTGAKELPEDLYKQTLDEIKRAERQNSF